ncbi:unnamed protein product [Ectocarpus sp. CCAP 1310/34]|nr:unnamed protein product [Ectocarpus sp. CCAP 1310/34]
MLFGDEYEIDVRLYLHFDDDIMVNALARRLRTAVERDDLRRAPN